MSYEKKAMTMTYDTELDESLVSTWSLSWLASHILAIIVGLIEQTKGWQKKLGHLHNSCSDEEQDMVVKPERIMDLLMTEEVDRVVVLA